jgi:hypothetical protein
MIRIIPAALGTHRGFGGGHTPRPKLPGIGLRCCQNKARPEGIQNGMPSDIQSILLGCHWRASNLGRSFFECLSSRDDAAKLRFTAFYLFLS